MKYNPLRTRSPGVFIFPFEVWFTFLGWLCVALLLVTIAKNYVKMRQVHQGAVGLCPKTMIPQ